MSQSYPPNPFGAPSDLPPNPYNSPQFFEQPQSGSSLIQAVKSKLWLPAIGLCVVGVLGMVSSVAIAFLMAALNAAQVKPDPNDPLGGPLSFLMSPDGFFIHIISFFINVTIIVGAVQMMQVKVRPICFVATILAMINCATPTCLLALPIGIWSFIILCQSDVARAFEENY